MTAKHYYVIITVYGTWLNTLHMFVNFIKAQCSSVQKLLLWFLSSRCIQITLRSYNFNSDKILLRKKFWTTVKDCRRSASFLTFSKFLKLNGHHKTNIKGKNKSPFSAKKWNHHNFPNANYRELVNTKYHERGILIKRGTSLLNPQAGVDTKFSGISWTVEGAGGDT